MSELTDLIRQVNRLQITVENLVKPEVGRWIDWTPAVDQNGAVTSTVDYARYIVLISDVVILIAHVNITGAGTAGQIISVSGIPAAIQPIHTDAAGLYPFGWSSVADAGTATYHGVAVPVAADDIQFRQATTGFVGANPSFALANGDEISFTAIYER